MLVGLNKNIMAALNEMVVGALPPENDKAVQSAPVPTTTPKL